jgi:hypothetical protein
LIVEERVTEVTIDRLSLLKYLYDETNSPDFWVMIKAVQKFMDREDQDSYEAVVQLPGVPVPLAKLTFKKCLNSDGVIHEGRSDSPKAFLRFSVTLLGKKCLLRAEYEGPMEYFARRLLRNVLNISVKKLEELPQRLRGLDSTA